MRIPYLLATLGVTFTLGACKDDAVPTSAKPDCDAIVERCHPLDPGSGPIHECHETAESRETSNAMCVAQHAVCFAVCVATDGGGGGGADASADAATGGADASADAATGGADASADAATGD